MAPGVSSHSEVAARVGLGGRLAGKAGTFLEAIKFEHTIFALPFAYLGMLLAAGGAPTLAQFFWITVAMGAARTLEMALFAAAAGVVLVVAAWQLNPLCLQLLPGAVVVLVGYSYTKRFAWLSHAVLGVADALAP